MARLDFILHGLSVSFETEDSDLHDFVREYFGTHDRPGARPALSIRASWGWGGRANGSRAVTGGRAGAEGETGRGEEATAERAGRGLTLAAGPDGSLRAEWSRVPDFPELQMTFDIAPGPPAELRVGADCAYVPRGLARRLRYMKSSAVEKKRGRLFFKLVYFMVYYPMAWYLERTRGWGLLHASAVTLPDGGAVLLSGLGGVGKSTLGLALLQGQDAGGASQALASSVGTRSVPKLLSDNLLFHDEQSVYACPEPVRLDARSLAGIGGSAGAQRTGLPVSAHPKPTYRVDRNLTSMAAPPEAVYFLRFARRSGETPIPAARAAEMLLAGNDLAREIKDYRPCAALLTMIAAEAGGPPAAPRASLTGLLSRARCFIFRIGEGEPIARTAARLADHVGARA